MAKMRRSIGRFPATRRSGGWLLFGAWAQIHLSIESTLLSSSIYLHKFHQGKEVAVSFEEVIGFLAKYGTPGVGRYVNEVTFAVNEIAELANVVGSEADGALCIAISRPLINDQFRQFVFEPCNFLDFRHMKTHLIGRMFCATEPMTFLTNF
ncbi:hypothetical protein J2W28_001941 [Variovorax boronicumulans]|uniref:hypothetical protein n=1 Tax=Variovorax boronicumulans TaxID=436515 RepID=UPI00277E1DD2|nr:hypothetical protein [Variovorax boronicumulans]MDP9990771.1 hypothetical protein [Variovorax boronicumulans]MDQ0002799.1 hypothetical protein [Variovorax boronicumulans]